jgi:hypothetical protein
MLPTDYRGDPEYLKIQEVKKNKLHIESELFGHAVDELIKRIKYQVFY